MTLGSFNSLSCVGMAGVECVPDDACNWGHGEKVSGISRSSFETFSVTAKKVQSVIHAVVMSLDPSHVVVPRAQARCCQECVMHSWAKEVCSFS